MDGIHDCVSVSRIAMEWKAYHLDAKDVLLTGTRTIVKIHSYRCPITLLMVSPCKNTLHCMDDMSVLESKLNGLAIQEHGRWCAPVSSRHDHSSLSAWWYSMQGNIYSFP